MAARKNKTSTHTSSARLSVGLMLVTVSLIALVPGVNAVEEYDCRDQEVCDPSADEEDAGCSFAAEWGNLNARVWGVPTTSGVHGAALSASADAIGGDNFDRWIITLCDSVDFRPYASATAEASTTHCYKDGPSHPWPCAGVSSTWVTNTAGSGSGNSVSAFCGWNKCDGVNSGIADDKVEDIALNQPGNKRVDVWGDASARYYEDRQGNGCVLCEESLRDWAEDTDIETFWIGSTPPL